MERKAVLNDIYISNFNDIRAVFTLYEDDKKVANIVVSQVLVDIENIEDIEDLEDLEEIKNSLKEKVLSKFMYFKTLPKISNGSKLLKYIYKSLYEYNMFSIYNDEWEELKEENKFNEDDLKELKEDIIKYNLQDLISIDYDDNFKIIAWGDLELMFNNDLESECE